MNELQNFRSRYASTGEFLKLLNLERIPKILNLEFASIFQGFATRCEMSFP